MFIMSRGCCVWGLFVWGLPCLVFVCLGSVMVPIKPNQEISFFQFALLSFFTWPNLQMSLFSMRMSSTTVKYFELCKIVTKFNENYWNFWTQFLFQSNWYSSFDQILYSKINFLYPIERIKNFDTLKPFLTNNLLF